MRDSKTFLSAVALVAAPRVQWGVVAGVALALALHLWRELRLDVEVWAEHDLLHVRPQGVLYFGAAPSLETRILDELVAAGRLGQKSGAGFYSYAKGSRGVDDPAFAALLEKCRRGRREVGAEEITDRLFLPMLTEASRVLAEGIVREPADVDMGLILGIGFPPFRGGLLRWADTVGLKGVVERLKKYEALGPRFRPTEQMTKLAAEGKGFYPA